MPVHLNRPNLVVYYIDAVKEVYAVHANVKRADYDRFEKTEVELMRKGINVKHYAITIAKLWRFWCEKQGLRCVPVNTFLGQKSQEWYDEYALFAIDVVRPSYRRAKVLDDEYKLGSFVVRSIVNGSRVDEMEVARALGLSELWWEAEADGTRPTVAVAEVIAKLFGVPANTSDYYILAGVILDRQIYLEQSIP